MEQKYSSKATSINGKGKRVPAVFKKMPLYYKSTNLDYGGGESDVVQEWLDKEHAGIKNYVMDKYNRSEEHNRAVREEIEKMGGTDTCTISNVLNVIKEDEVRQEVIRDAYSLLKEHGYMYITVYEGDRSEVGKETKKDCWQNNQPLSFYVGDVFEALGDTVWAIKKGMLIIRKDTAVIEARKEMQQRAMEELKLGKKIYWVED